MMLARQNGLIDDLNKYTDTKVKISREKTKAAVRRVLNDVIQPILKYIHDQDPRFSQQEWSSGSYASGLKVAEPDEFDFNVSLEGLPDLCWVTSPLTSLGIKPAYYTINSTGQLVESTVPLPSPPNGYHNVILRQFIGSEVWNKGDMKKGDYLVPFKTRSAFKGLVAIAIRERGLRDVVRLYNKTHGPAITLSVHFGSERISVDLVPLVPANRRGLPPSVLSNWPRSTKWPPKHKVDEVRQVGTDSVAKDDLYWLTSFMRCELALLEDIDKDGGCRKQCLRILKKIREDNWITTTKPALSSFHLKTLLFWECEKYPDTSDWSRDKLGERFIGMVQTLKIWVRNKHCPHYFIPTINLFQDKNGTLKDSEGLSTTGERIGQFLDNPCHFLRV